MRCRRKKCDATEESACVGRQRQLEGPSVSRNAARERRRVRSLRGAFLGLQRRLPSVPPDTKLSKLDVLVLASAYIAHLARVLEDPLQLRVPSEESEVPNTVWEEKTYLHPVKKWPMRSRLYAGVEESTISAENEPCCPC